MTTTNPTQAQKFFWLGLSRSVNAVSDDDVPPDAVTIDNFTITNTNTFPTSTTVNFEYTITNTTTNTVSTTAVISANDVSRLKKSYELTDSESITDTATIFVNLSGYYVFTLSVGTNTASVTRRIS